MSDRNSSIPVKVTVVIFVNGTIYRHPKEDPIWQVAEPILLALLFLGAFTANMFLLLTITTSYTLKRVAFNILIVNMSIVCLSECTFNMFFTLYFTVMDTWKPELALCSISAFSVQLVTLEATFGVCIMCVEGWISLWKPSHYQNHLTPKKQTVAIVTLWMAGILLCLPLLVGLIGSRLFPARYGCAAADKNSFEHGVFLTAFCYALPIALASLSLLCLAARKCKDNQAMKSRKQDLSYTDIFFQGDLWTEWINIKLVVVTAVLYALLELPYTIVHQITEIRIHEQPLPPLPINETYILIEDTPRYETAFTWFRYVYAAAYPAVTLRMRKDIRKKLVSLISCCRKNSVGNYSPRPMVRTENKNKKKEEKKEEEHPLSLTTPVLYISPDGLCLRHLDSNANIEDRVIVSSPDYPHSNWTVEPSFVSYLCDVDCSDTQEDFDRISWRDDESISRRNSKESEISVETLGSQSDIPKEPQSPESTIDSSVPLLEQVEQVLNEVNNSLSPEPPPLTPPPPPQSPKETPSTPVKKQKKKVRFAETLTMYRPLTPREYTPTPSPIFTISSMVDGKLNCSPSRQSKQEQHQSKIPTRTSWNTSPWKVETNTTYRVSAPTVPKRTVKTIIPPPKKGSGNADGVVLKPRSFSSAYRRASDFQRSSRTVNNRFSRTTSQNSHKWRK